MKYLWSNDGNVYILRVRCGGLPKHSMVSAPASWSSFERASSFGMGQRRYSAISFPPTKARSLFIIYPPAYLRIIPIWWDLSSVFLAPTIRACKEQLHVILNNSRPVFCVWFTTLNVNITTVQICYCVHFSIYLISLGNPYFFSLAGKLLSNLGFWVMLTIKKSLMISGVKYFVGLGILIAFN